MRAILLNAVKLRTEDAPTIHELTIDAKRERDGSGTLTDLVLVDASGMPPERFPHMLEWIAQLRTTHKIGRVVMIWPEPPIELVVRALRSGVNEILQRPASPGQLYRALIRGTKTKAARLAARAILACGRMIEVGGAAAGAGSSEFAEFLKWDRRLRHREDRLAEEARRLEDQREILQHREADLRSSACRLEAEFARLQNDADVRGTSPQPRGELGRDTLSAEERRLAEVEERLRAAETHLRLRTAQLEQREKDIAAREQMLRDFGRMLGKLPA